MVDNITVPMARASILWLIGEYSERVPKIAPDVLRKMAKGFISEVCELHWTFFSTKILLLKQWQVFDRVHSYTST